MKKQIPTWLSFLRFLAPAFLVTTLAAANGAQVGQVVMDGSLGRAGALSGPAYLVTPDLGRQMGGNLFHSFSQLNLVKGESATFSGPASVQNILARVTGGASSIDGKLSSTIAGANLYLLNPAGVMFGQNASLDVTGSFVVSTADYVTLAGGGRFEARVPANSVLKETAVEKFGFLAMAPAKITVDGCRLTVPRGKSLTLVGGDITIQNTAPVTSSRPNARLTAQEGMVSLTSVGAGVSPVSVAADGTLADLRQGGSIKVSGPAGSTSVDVNDASTSGTGAGAVMIRAKDLTLDGTEIRSNSLGANSGRGIGVTLGGTGVLRNGGSLNSRTSGRGQSGPISVTTAGALELYSRGRISASTDGSGNAGYVTIRSTTLTLDGTDPTSTSPASITSNSNGPGGGGTATGRAGDVTVNVDGLLQVLHRGTISASTSGAGHGGNVTVTAGAMTIDRGNEQNFTGLSSNSTRPDQTPIGQPTVTPGPGGDAGAINLTVTGPLVIRNGGQIASTTSGSGKAGAVTVNAASLTIDARAGGVTYNSFAAGYGFTGIFSDCIHGSRTGTTASGAAGNVVVRVTGELQVLNGGELTSVPGIAGISSSSAGLGDGGSVTVSARTISLLNGGRIAASTGIYGDTGSAGKVEVRATDSILLRGNSLITSRSDRYQAGGLGVNAVFVDAGQRLDVYNSSITGASASGSGGNLKLIATDRVHLDHSSIVSQSGGSGGNIFIDPVTVSLSQSVISANAILGNGGNITIDTGYLIRSQDSQITASSVFGLNGQVTVLGPSVDLSGSLVPLRAGFLGAESRLPERCAVRLSGNVSSFISVGRGGLPLEPGDYQPLFLPLEERVERKDGRP